MPSLTIAPYRCLRAVQFIFTCLFGMGFNSAQAQMPLPDPDLDLLTNGTVLSMVRQPDGALVIAGYFTSINGVPRHGLARLKADRSLDLDWDPSPDYWASALAVDGNGNLYIGGNFTTIAGAPHAPLVRMLGTSDTVDPVWTPCCFNADNIVAIAVDQHWIYAAGYFQGSYLRRFSIANGNSDEAWQGSANGYVRVLTLDGNDALYAAGEFDFIGGSSTSYVAKLSATTGMADTTWHAAIPGLAPRTVNAIATAGRGAVYVGGTFGLHKLSAASGARMRNWTLSTSPVTTLAPSSDGSVYVGGTFDIFGGQSRANLAKVSATNGLALPGWQPTANAGVSTLILGPDGTADVAGAFYEMDGSDRVGLAQLKASGLLEPTRNDLEMPGSVEALASQIDGSVVAGGNFLKVGQQMRKHLLRLRPDGALDPAWNPTTPFAVWKLAADADQYVYAAGSVAWKDGRRPSQILRMSGTGIGEIDPEWSSEADDWITTLAVDHNGHAYVGGEFTSINGIARQSIARLAPSSGDPEASWNALADCCVGAIAFDANDDLYLGGTFSHVGGMSRAGLARVSATSAMPDPVWNPGAGGIVYALAVDSHGDVYAGGQFGLIGGQNHWNVAKLHGDDDGQAYAGWDARLHWVWDLNLLLYGVWTIALDANDTVYLNGLFGVAGGPPVERSLARFSGANGLVDFDWRPGYNRYYNYALTTAGERLYVGGGFLSINGVPRQGLAALQTTLPDRLFAADFEAYSP